MKGEWTELDTLTLLVGKEYGVGDGCYVLLRVLVLLECGGCDSPSVITCQWCCSWLGVVLWTLNDLGFFLPYSLVEVYVLRQPINARTVARVIF